MYVELTYTYRPLFGTMFIGEQELRQDAAYTVRGAREIGKEPTDNVVAARKSTCVKYDALLTQTSDADIAAAQARAAKNKNELKNGVADGNAGNGNNKDDDDDEDSLCILGLVCVKI